MALQVSVRLSRSPRHSPRLLNQNTNPILLLLSNCSNFWLVLDDKKIQVSGIMSESAKAQGYYAGYSVSQKLCSV